MLAKEEFDNKPKTYLSAKEIKKYTGRGIINRLDSVAKKEAYDCNWQQLHLNYGDNVDFQLRWEQVLLCEQTEHYLYNDFTPKITQYTRGERPQLEKITAEVTKNCSDNREKMIALMRFCRDLYKKYNRKQLFYGGTEEELIKKGEQLCECLGRLMVALCEVEGIPGRIVMHVIGGHIVSELYVDGQWAYVDPRCGIYCLHPDGSFASIKDIRHNPDLLKHQPDEVKSEISPLWTWEERLNLNLNKYFNANEVIVFNNYSLMNAKRYGYDWLPVSVALEDRFVKIHNRYEELNNIVFGIHG